MRVRYKKSPNDVCFSDSFNTHALSEVIVGGDWGMDSAFIRELDVLINDQWKDMGQAFQDKDIVPDNLNQYFGKPINKEAKERGYNP